MAGKRVYVDVSPEMLRWARERARLSIDDLQRAFPRLEAWEQGEARPTLKQLEAYARKTHTPFGFFFLEQPPEEKLPIPDFRTMPAAQSRRPSPDLLETIYLCQQRQEWYRDYALTMGEARLPFVGSATLEDDIVAVAATMRERVGFDIEARSRMRTWEEARRRFIESVEAAGVLVMVSGIVKGNTHRKLDPEEFRGFALVDDLAPLVFINAADTKAAQMFTLAHELAHIWLGKTGVSNASLRGGEDMQRVERWCNQVAAEMLVPMARLRQIYRGQGSLDAAMQHLARHFKVSALVILRRLYDAGEISREMYWQTFAAELARVRDLSRPAEKGGGNFYRTLKIRVGRRFAEAVVVSALKGRLLYRDAYQMLGGMKLDRLIEILHWEKARFVLDSGSGGRYD